MTSPQPSLFVLHGAPTFALRLGAVRALARPRAIVIVSAHGDTATPHAGTDDYVLAMDAYAFLPKEESSS